jgi:hypothetical protein
MIFNREFEDLAIGVAKVFEFHTREVVNDVLITRYIKEYGMDCLQLSVECGCEKFVSSSIVQRNLFTIWRGPRTIEIELVI